MLVVRQYLINEKDMGCSLNLKALDENQFEFEVQIWFDVFRIICTSSMAMISLISAEEKRWMW